MLGKPTYIDDYRTSKAFSGGSRLVYGTSAIGGVWGPVNEAESIDAVLYALEHGISVLDTAPSYANAELYVGKALRQWRGQQPFISTKVGRLRGEDAFEVKLDYSKEGMQQSLYNSLETLGLDYIDLLFLHEPQLVPLDDIQRVLEVLKTFKSEGLVGKLGVGGNPSPAFMPYCTGEHFDVVSGFLRMDACNLSVFNGEIQHYQKEGIAYYAASALHFGLLGRRFKQYQKEGPNQDWITAKDLENARKVNDLAHKLDLPLATLALRYLFSIAEADRVVMGARNLQQIQSTIADWELGKLPEEVFNQITVIHST